MIKFARGDQILKLMPKMSLPREMGDSLEAIIRKKPSLMSHLASDAEEAAELPSIVANERAKLAPHIRSLNKKRHLGRKLDAIQSMVDKMAKTKLSAMNDRIVKLQAIKGKLIEFIDLDDDDERRKRGLPVKTIAAGTVGAGGLYAAGAKAQGLNPLQTANKLKQNLSSIGRGGASDAATAIRKGGSVAKGALAKLLARLRPVATALSSNDGLIEFEKDRRSNLFINLPDDHEERSVQTVRLRKNKDRRWFDPRVKVSGKLKIHKSPKVVGKGQPVVDNVKNLPGDQGQDFDYHDIRSPARIRRAKAVGSIGIAGGLGYLAGLHAEKVLKIRRLSSYLEDVIELKQDA